MFNTLEEQIAKTEGPPLSSGVRAWRYVGLFLLSAAVFGVLYAAIRLAG